MALRRKSAPAQTAEKTETAEKNITTVRKTSGRKTAARRVSERTEPLPDATAIQRGARQSPYKMRLVIDQIRGKNVNEALGLLRFSKKHAAKQIEKTLNSAVANAEHAARQNNEPLDVDELYIKHAIVNEGPKIKRFMSDDQA